MTSYEDLQYWAEYAACRMHRENCPIEDIQRWTGHHYTPNERRLLNYYYRAFNKRFYAWCEANDPNNKEK